MAELAKCRSCGANIMWVRDVTGNLMPLDIEPAEDGDVAIKDNIAHTFNGTLFEEMMDGPMYKSHFATCPNAVKHRKPKK